MIYQFGFMIESLVAVLLLLTILYCVRLNKQLNLLKADERSFKATIGELLTATGNAERAIEGLKATMRESEQLLGNELTDAERISGDLHRQIEAGENLLDRLTRIAAATPADGETAPQPPSDARSVAAAAQAFAERMRGRVRGLAA